MGFMAEVKKVEDLVKDYRVDLIVEYTVIQEFKMVDISDRDF